ncbi:long-chain-fatty-acid--CoA ligase [Rhodospirillaceae bacterium AH-315-P19]|nr:long-chain-fatty-acid--CoA ligase [Rhodospirillaceae bacterium AH-315-P19]
MLQTIGQILPASAARFGDKTALIFEGRSFSYNELEQLSNRLANGLRDLGIGARDCVSIYGPNCWEWLVAYHAIAKIGAVLNPINVMLTPEEVAFVVNDCKARALIASADKGEAVLDKKGATPLNNVILFGNKADPPAGTLCFEDMIAQGKPDFDPVLVAPEELSTIGYTSGTTGHPKGAMQSHRSVLLNLALTANMHVKTAADTVVTALPCPHVYGNIVINGAFFTGMTVVLLSRFDEKETLDAIQTHKATLFEGVPTMYMYMLNSPELAKHDLSSLTRCTVGGQTMPVAKMEEVEKHFGCPLLELWGMTELAGAATTNTFYGENRHGSIGLPLPGTQVRIADIEDATKSLAPGEVGEMMVKGPLVMLGYYGNAKATKDAIEPDGWMHTGDVGKMDEDGYLYIVDRRKDMILTGGFNIYPAELERVISAHPAVAMVAVGGQPDATKGEIAKAYIVLRDGVQIDADAIRAYCREHMAAYKVPKRVQFVDDFPKTSTGKIMRRKLKTLDPPEERESTS